MSKPLWWTWVEGTWRGRYRIPFCVAKLTPILFKKFSRRRSLCDLDIKCRLMPSCECIVLLQIHDCELKVSLFYRGPVWLWANWGRVVAISHHHFTCRLGWKFGSHDSGVWVSWREMHVGGENGGHFLNWFKCDLSKKSCRSVKTESEWYHSAGSNILYCMPHFYLFNRGRITAFILKLCQFRASYFFQIYELQSCFVADPHLLPSHV